MKKTGKQFLEKIISSVGRAINAYGLITAEDRVAVALSGGKDSLVLLETLVLRKKRLPIDYSVIAIHVEMEEDLYRADTAYLHEYCGKLEVPLVLKKTSLGTVPENPCFICSRQRRKELFTAAGEWQCNKLALGHHRDDALETLLLNMVFNGSISSMPPKLPIFDASLDIIRPLILLSDDDIKEYAEIKKFRPMIKECPHGIDSKREHIKTIIKSLEQMNPGARQSIFRAMSNIHREYLP